MQVRLTLEENWPTPNIVDDNYKGDTLTVELPTHLIERYKRASGEWATVCSEIFEHYTRTEGVELEDAWFEARH